MIPLPCGLGANMEPPLRMHPTVGARFDVRRFLSQSRRVYRSFSMRPNTPPPPPPFIKKNYYKPLEGGRDGATGRGIKRLKPVAKELERLSASRYRSMTTRLPRPSLFRPCHGKQIRSSYLQLPIGNFDIILDVRRQPPRLFCIQLSAKARPRGRNTR